MLSKLFKKKSCFRRAEALEAGEITSQAFAELNAEVTVYYSTPFGEDRQGRTQLWVLSNAENSLKHYPAFTSKAACNRFLASIGRQGGFLIIEGDLRDLLDSLDSHEVLMPLGVVIDPMSEHPIALDPGTRVKA